MNAYDAIQLAEAKQTEAEGVPSFWTEYADGQRLFFLVDGTVLHEWTMTYVGSEDHKT